jgi:hypothetical protein
MNEDMSDLPQAIAADPDGVQVALRAAHTLWSRGDTAESLKWLRKAAETASDEGADIRSLQLAKAAAELRAKLLGGSEPPARSAFAGSSFSAGASGSVSAGGTGMSFASPLGAPGSVAPAHQGSGAFPPSDVGPGESGSHPIAQPRARPESEPPRAASSSAPPIEAFAAGAAPEDGSGAMSSRPVTATQYPSHRPRQRMGLLSASPASTREGSAYASVPSWSADSERHGSAAPPPLPGASLDDYEELEAEPDDEAADDPGSVWSSDGPESWHPESTPTSHDAQSAAARSAAPGATPPPLPPRGAFADDDNDFTQQQPEAQTVVMAPLEENGEAEPRSARDSRRASEFDAAGSGARGSAWDQQARMPSWDHDAGSSWAAELQQSALHQSTWGSATGPDDSASQEASSSEAASQSETARAKLTARVHHQAVRVSFAPDLRVPGQYVVRPLREGEKAATGERVALLVALEPGVPLV